MEAMSTIFTGKSAYNVDFYLHRGKRTRFSKRTNGCGVCVFIVVVYVSNVKTLCN